LIYKGYDTGANLRIRNNNVLPATNVNIGLFYIMPGQNNVIKTLKTEALGTIAKNAYRDVFLSGRVDQSIPIGTMINIFAQVDYNKVVPETNEENNKLEYSIPILERPRQLSCPCLQIIVNDEDGEPMNKATVTLAGATTSETKITGAENWYNSNGSVIFENRPATASYSVTVASSSYRTQSQSFNYDKNNDDTTYRYFNMDKKALVTGQVKNHIGQPLPWTFVRVDGIGLEAVTDAQGKYGFLLNGGTYNLRFVREGYNRILQNGYVVAPLSAVTLDKTMTPGNTAFMTGNITDDEGNPLYSVDVYVNNTILGMTNQAGKYSINLIGAPGKKITFKKPGFVNTELTEDITGGLEYNYDLVMYKPNTANHVERGTNIVSWHQHEGTPANAYWIPEYNVDIWWGLGNVKMGMDFNKSGNTTKISKLVVNVHGREWECNRVEGEGEVETSAIDIPITIAAGSCSGKQTQMDVYKVAIESGGMEVWSDSSFWTSASDPVNTGTKVFTLNNIPVVWDNDLKVKLWTRVQKKAVIGTDGDGAGALYGYHLDKKLITWYPQKPPTTKISTSWKQVGGYFLGILDNPVNAITGFTDMFTVDQFNQYTMEEVLPQNFPGYIND
jgi:protocatechuate 3,4-dioxygenase beta subunit